jgi:hypothetical protein
LKKDWIGNAKSTYTTLGASNHTDKEREENDFYATEPVAAEWLLKLEPLSNHIWECACGLGHLSKVFEEAGHKVYSTDAVDRGYGKIFDFISGDSPDFDGDIVTNPPYKYASEFIYESLKKVSTGRRVCMFLKVQFLEGKTRRQMFNQYPPKTIWVSSSRLQCAKNADFAGIKAGGGSAVAFAWFVWVKGFNGTTELKWFN